MSEIDQKTLSTQLRGVLLEAFEGPPDGFAYFSDRGEDAGLLNLLRGISAAEASRPVAGNSIAAQIHHLTFALKASTAWICGEQTRPHWPESWSVSEVNEDSWKGLAVALEGARSDFMAAVESMAFSNEMAVGITLGNVAHIAYHLGVVRQKLKLVRD